MDELFEQRLHAWQFRNAITSGVVARVREIEQGIIKTPKQNTEDLEFAGYTEFQQIEDIGAHADSGPESRYLGAAGETTM